MLVSSGTNFAFDVVINKLLSPPTVMVVVLPSRFSIALNVPKEVW